MTTFPATTTMPADPATLRSHIVIDGDSLARLADRYLGNAQRGDEIFRLNRDQLTSPDLLPIGAELKIPERSTSSIATSAAATVDNFGPAPTGETQAAINGAPRAQLMRPVAAGRDSSAP